MDGLGMLPSPIILENKMFGFNKKLNVELGDKVRDKVTGFEGIAVAKTEWLNGCIRVTLQPPISKDGKIPESGTFDEPQLEVIEAGKVNTGSRETGGPAPNPKQHNSPTR